MPLERSEIQQSLKNKGFLEKEGGDHNFFTYHTTEGKKTNIFTKTSRGSKNKTIDDSTVSKMSRQCKLTNKLFIQLIKCTLSRSEYQKHLVDNKHITLGSGQTKK